jgi:hypothetical protein
MELHALTNQLEIKRAVERLANTLRGGAYKPFLVIATPGRGTYGRPEEVMWHPNHHLWAYVELKSRGPRYWCAYGVTGPEVGKQRPIVQINSPADGVNLNCQGVFASDDQGKHYYLHTGRLGGGSLAAGKAFADFWNEEGPSEFVQSALVRWPDGSRRSMFIIGEVGDPTLVAALAKYVNAVADFRRQRQSHPDLARLPAVFVSHSNSREDKEWCEQFHDELVRFQIPAVWYDKHSLAPGQLRPKLLEAIKNHPGFIVIVSFKSMASGWVREEVKTALALYDQEPDDRFVLPVEMKVCPGKYDPTHPCNAPDDPWNDAENPWKELASLGTVKKVGGGDLTPKAAATAVIKKLRMEVEGRKIANTTRVLGT